jgi:orotidine-5'-phosphate decarboxylase
MRIDIDQELEKELDAIKMEKWISGKGHTETVRFLAQHYKEHDSIERLVDQKLSDIQSTIEKSIMGAFRKILNNLLGRE